MRALVGHEREQSTDALSTEDAIAMQNLRLNEAQWARVMAENDLHPTAQFTPRSDATPSSSSLQTAYVLSLEGDEPNAKWSWYETMLDAVVQSAQPAPANPAVCSNESLKKVYDNMAKSIQTTKA